MTSGPNLSTSTSPTSNVSDVPTKTVSRRGRPRNSLPDLRVESGTLLSFPIRSNPKDWLHRHPKVSPEKKPPNWKSASLTPVLGRAVLDAVHALSFDGGPLGEYKSALSCQALMQPFFKWLAEMDPDQSGERPGAATLKLRPTLFDEFKKHINDRVAAKLITSRTGYKYKGETLRVLRHMWDIDNSVFGPGWNATKFQNDDFVDDHGSAEPYSPAEAKRIVGHCAALISKHHLSTDSTAFRFAEVAANAIVGLKLGIEPECINRLAFGNLHVEGKGGRIRVKYLKLRNGGGDGARKQRAANKPKTAHEYDDIDASGVTFKDAGGVLSFLRDAARIRNETCSNPSALADEPLFTRECDQYDFRRLTEILFIDGLRGDDGDRLSLHRPRLRVTWRATRTVRHGGRLSIDQRDNSKNVRSRHYLRSEHLKPLYEDAVLAAQQKAIDFALKPIVIDLPPDASASDIKKAALDAGVSSAAVTAAVLGETDVWLASCRSFTNSPFDAPGKPCSRPFYGCVLCANALVTRRSLPAITAFRDHLVRRRDDMATAEWEMMFGNAYRQIVAEILPKFPGAVVEEAERIARGMDIAIHLPPEIMQ